MKECPEIQYLNSLLTGGLNKFKSLEIDRNTVNNNTTTTGSGDNWWKLLSKEAVCIKQVKRSLNSGLIESRDISFFSRYY